MLVAGFKRFQNFHHFLTQKKVNKVNKVKKVNKTFPKVSSTDQPGGGGETPEKALWQI